jgi:hypothetical protein
MYVKKKTGSYVVKDKQLTGKYNYECERPSLISQGRLYEKPLCVRKQAFDKQKFLFPNFKG